MNQFRSINRKNGLSINNKSPFYGRYRLAFNQVSPFREPLFDRLIIKLKNHIEAKNVFNSFPEHISIIHFFKQEDIRKNKFWDLDFFEDEDEFLVFEMLSDVIYIALENIYFSIKELAPFMEDCYFFIYSTGDGDEHWIDEYQIKDSKLFFKRNYTKSEMYYGRLDFYLTKLEENTGDKNFMKFTLFQLYDKLHFLVKDLIKYPTLHSIEKSTLHDTHKKYLKKLYSLDKECQDFGSLNIKYNFKYMM